MAPLLTARSAKMSTQSHEIRFDSLPDCRSAVTAILQATREFAKDIGVLVHVPSAGGGIVDLVHHSGFRYADQYQPFAEALQNGEKVTIATVLQNGRVIAYGFAEVPTKHGVEIMTIDVSEESRRSDGVKSTVTIHGEPFEIGIGHVLVLGLIEAIEAETIHTNATTAAARYIFKSLGFMATDEDNSCLLNLINPAGAGNEVAPPE